MHHISKRNQERSGHESGNDPSSWINNLTGSKRTWKKFRLDQESLPWSLRWSDGMLYPWSRLLCVCKLYTWVLYCLVVKHFVIYWVFTYMYAIGNKSGVVVEAFTPTKCDFIFWFAETMWCLSWFCCWFSSFLENQQFQNPITPGKYGRYKEQQTLYAYLVPSKSLFYLFICYLFAY